MKYKLLRVGLVLVAVGAYLALQGFQEVRDDLGEGQFDGPDERYLAGYQAGRLSGLAEARDLVDAQGNHVAHMER